MCVFTRFVADCVRPTQTRSLARVFKIGYVRPHDLGRQKQGMYIGFYYDAAVDVAGRSEAAVIGRDCSFSSFLEVQKWVDEYCERTGIEPPRKRRR